MLVFDVVYCCKTIDDSSIDGLDALVADDVFDLKKHLP